MGWWVISLLNSVSKGPLPVSNVLFVSCFPRVSCIRQTHGRTHSKLNITSTILCNLGGESHTLCLFLSWAKTKSMHYTYNESFIIYSNNTVLTINSQHSVLFLADCMQNEHPDVFTGKSSYDDLIKHYKIQTI